MTQECYRIAKNYTMCEVVSFDAETKEIIARKRLWPTKGLRREKRYVEICTLLNENNLPVPPYEP